MTAVSDLDATFLDELAAAVGSERLHVGAAQREAYAWDNTGRRFLPQAVVLPETQEQVAGVLRACHRAQVPVVPRGAGTGCVGGGLAV
ncbi:MAG: FAD-binding oxidoreductase, partial [Magnetococcales bacterium]|nr:FAD-binding oxidoreductase [Magnetococcales bacterium]